LAGYTSSNDDHGDIPAWRQILNVVGLVLMGIGFLLFISMFFSAAGMFSSATRGFGSQSIWELDGARFPDFSRAVMGVLLVAIGGALRRVAVAGLAGSGLVLSPGRARHDLKPWAKMTGNLINDAVSEVDAVRELTSTRGQSARQGAPAAKSAEQPAVVKVRCQKCKALNDEDAKYCDQCGAGL
jgi:ribosomal protein L40E